jgi:hypothetical protein
VTIVERDRYPDGPAPRKGVPQARHLHILLMRGQRILDRMFPGFVDELVSHGATLIDAARAVAVLVGLVLNAAVGWWWADPLARQRGDIQVAGLWVPKTCHRG